MLKLLIFRFWPVLIPLLVYWIWHRTHVARARKNNQPVPRFRDGPWYWLVLSCLVVGVGCFLWWGATEEQVKGRFVPAHMENGIVVPAHVEPSP